MAYDPANHHRRSIRLHDFDYRAEGAYFITICTRDKQCIFGDIIDGILRPSRRGLIAQQCWDEIPHHRPYVELDQFVVMPNHIHGIFWITQTQAPPRATQVSALHGATPGSVGAIVGSYKAAVSRTINRLHPGAGNNLWQQNYFEHVIRHQLALDAIREYIFTNPERWDADRENPNGTGRDDVEAFIQSVDDLVKRTKGNTSVAPTGEER